MKTSILHLLALALVLSFTAACGKKESGGSGNPPTLNNSTVPTGNSTGETAWNALKGWYESSADNIPGGIHGFYLKKAQGGFNFGGMCLTNTAVVNCEAPTGCFKNTTQGVKAGTVVMATKKTIFEIPYKVYSDCDISSATVYTKSSNQALKEAIFGKAGLYVIKGMTQQTNSIFKVYFGSYDGSNTPVAHAVVNLSLPSIINPTEVANNSGIVKLEDYRIAQ